MKFFLLLTTFLILKQIYAGNILYSDLVQIKGIYYKKKSSNVFTGKVVGIYEGEFKEGMKHGEFIKYYGNGKVLSKINFFENRLNGNWTEYYRNGNLLIKKTFKNDLLEGEYIDYYSFGQVLSKRFYMKDKLEGIYEEFYKNGQLHIKTNYKNNVLDGEYIVYHEYEFNPIVQIKSKKFYSNGKKEGVFLEFDENGNKIKEGFYIKGKLEGEFFTYNKFGKILSKLVYKDGLLIKVALNQ